MGYLWCWKSFPTQCTIGLDLMTSCMTSNPKVSSFRINFYVIRSSINKNFLQKQKKWFSLYIWLQNMHMCFFFVYVYAHSTIFYVDPSISFQLWRINHCDSSKINLYLYYYSIFFLPNSIVNVWGKNSV
jgi:hypothetical protein